MIKPFFYLIPPLLLTGCIGAWISGNTGYLGEGYPDIRTVPERKEAIAPRGLHEKEEKTSRAADFKKLEEEREKINARNEALRENAFPNAQQEEVQ